MQHRGQESCGIVTGDGSRVRSTGAWGWCPRSSTKPSWSSCPGHLAIGHVRYSTTGSTMLINAQPFVVQHGGQMLAIGHNGTLTNAREIRCRLEEAGSIFQSTMDTEIIVHLMARHRGADLVESLIARPGTSARAPIPWCSPPRTRSSPPGTPTASGPCAWAS